jgi:hypothetical protein
MTFYTSRADVMSLAFSQWLVKKVHVQTNISVTFKDSTIVLYFKKHFDLQFMKPYFQFRRLPEVLNWTKIWDWAMN